METIGAAMGGIKNQFGRRNINDATRALLALQLEPLIRAMAKEKEADRKSTFPNLGKSPSTKIHTDTEIAKIAGVSKGRVDQLVER